MVFDKCLDMGLENRLDQFVMSLFLHKTSSLPIYGLERLIVQSLKSLVCMNLACINIVELFNYI